MPETTLYRAVTAAELADIAAAGAYRLSAGSIEGKYFFESAGEAAGFARKMFSLFPDEGAYTITSTVAPALVLQGCLRLKVAGEGMVWVVPERMLPLSPVSIWTYCPR